AVKMTFEVALATLKDVPDMSAVILEAYRGNRNTMANYMYPTQSPVMLPWRMKSMTREILKDPTYIYVKVTDTSSGQSPHKLQEEKNENTEGTEVEQWPQGSQVPLVKEYYAALDAKSEKYVDTEKDYVLKALNTHPAYHRKGCGSMLLEWGVKKADAEGARIYLDATPAGCALYLKSGWKVVDEVVIDLNKYGHSHVQTTVCMMREPTKGKRQYGPNKQRGL
ncbi:hypothetical protein MMC22_004499, partial [Lobaria immixta]|nr:hypothetical protein [Lobaria immixta]